MRRAIPMSSTEWEKVHQFACPCGYTYEPKKGDSQAGWEPGTTFEALPEFLTCPRCQRPKISFREKRFSRPVSSP